MTLQLIAGANAPLPAGPLELRLRSADPVDVALYRLTAAGRVRGDDDMIFYNQPRPADGSLHWQGDERDSHFNLDLARQPAEVAPLALTFVAARPVRELGPVRLTLSQRGAVLIDCPLDLAGGETALIVGECYRRGDGWKFRLLLQGFNGGLQPLAEHYGIEVAEPAAWPTPAVNLVKERQKLLLAKASAQQPQLVNLIKAAAVSLEKRGLATARYRVCLVLDISASMSKEYRNGTVQKLAERALALATQLDDDGEAEVYLFGERAHRCANISLDNVRGFIPQLNIQLEGGTDYEPVMARIRRDAREAGHRWPTLVLFITDGATENRRAVQELLVHLAAEPIFWKFMGIDRWLGGDFAFLEKLDNLAGRVVDNAHFFKVDAQVSLGDGELFDQLLTGLEDWQREIRARGIWRD